MDDTVKVQKEAAVADAEGGVVLLDGLAGLAISLTPDAAEQTAENLVAAAKQARSQQQDGEQS